jgi:hypothetical protein
MLGFALYDEPRYVSTIAEKGNFAVPGIEEAAVIALHFSSGPLASSPTCLRQMTLKLGPVDEFSTENRLGIPAGTQA